MIGSKDLHGMSLFFSFLYIGFNFPTLQASGKTPRDTDEL